MNNKEKFLSYDMALIMKKWYTIKKHWEKGDVVYARDIIILWDSGNDVL